MRNYGHDVIGNSTIQASVSTISFNVFSSELQTWHAFQHGFNRKIHSYVTLILEVR